VRVLDRKECKPSQRIEGVEYMVGDICDLSSRACFWACEKVHTIFHCARMADPTSDFNTHYETNVAGTQNILDAAMLQGVKCLVYTSSVSVVVDGSDINGGDETMPYPEMHLDHASATKALAEQLVMSMNGKPSKCGSPLYTCCIRPEMVFGPGDNHFVPQLIEKAREGEITHMIGDGSNVVDFTYVDNAVLAHLLAAEHMVEGSPALGQVYFVTNGEARPFWDFMIVFLDGMGFPAPTKAIGQRLAYGTAYVLEKAGSVLKHFLTFRPKLTRQLVFNMSMNHYFSHAKATNEIGYEPVVSLDQGIARTMEWILNERYEMDRGIFERWAVAREAMSPDAPRVVVPLSSRHSSSSSLDIEAMSAQGGYSDGGAMWYGHGKRPSSPSQTWYSQGTPGSDGEPIVMVPWTQHGTTHSPEQISSGLHIGSAAALSQPTSIVGTEGEGDGEERLFSTRSRGKSGSTINGSGSFCASIPEENEIEADYDYQQMAAEYEGAGEAAPMLLLASNSNQLLNHSDEDHKECVDDEFIDQDICESLQQYSPRGHKPHGNLRGNPSIRTLKIA